MVSGGPDVRRTEAMHQGDGEIAARQPEFVEHCRCASETDPPAIRDIAHIMGAILDAPMSAVELQQALGLAWRERGRDEIDHLGVVVPALVTVRVSCATCAPGPTWGEVGHSFRS